MRFPSLTGRSSSARVIAALVLFAIVIAVSASDFGAAKAAPVSFFDGNFANADWTIDVFESNPANDATSTRVSTGGNPGAKKRVVQTMAGAGSVSSIHLRIGATHNPSINGAINSIDYSEDAQTWSSEFNTWGAQSGPALKQDGFFYIAGTSPTRENYTDAFWPSGWKDISFTGLTQASFSRVTGPLTVDTGLKPDFSSTGSEIQFGFVRRNSHTGASTSIRTTEIDNWSMFLDVTPTILNPPVDVVFLVDESVSMGPEIAAVRSNIGYIAAELGDALDPQFAILGFANGSIGRNGSSPRSTPAVIRKDFPDPISLADAVDDLRPDWGAIEAGAYATDFAMNNLTGWRDHAGVCVVLITDEDNDGIPSNTRANQLANREAAKASLDARDAVFFGIIPGRAGNSEWDYGPEPSSLAAHTGGQVLNVGAFTSNPQPVVDALLNACRVAVTQGITLSPPTAENPVGTDHTVVARVQDDLGNDVEGTPVSFNVTAGPNTGDSGSGTTGADGRAAFTYTGDGGAGEDTITACFTDDGEQKCATAVKIWVGPDVPEPPTFLHDVPLPDPDACICLPPFMLVPDDATQYWWASATGDRPLEVTPIAVGVNDAENGSVTVEVFDPADSSVGSETVVHPGQGLETAGPPIVDGAAAAGDIYRIEINLVLPPDGPVAHHYRLELKGASLLGTNSPMQTQAEPIPMTWGLNVGAGESLDVSVMPGPGAPTTGDIVVRDPSGAHVLTGAIGGPPISIPGAAEGHWTITIPNSTGHYVVDKTSGVDTGIYVNWASFGTGTVDVTATVGGGFPYAGPYKVKIKDLLTGNEWIEPPSGPFTGPASLTLPVGNYEIWAVSRGHASERVTVSVTCNGTIAVTLDTEPCANR